MPRVTTDDKHGQIKTYVGDGEFTDDPLPTFGSRAVVKVDGLQKLLKHVCRNGFEHHTAMTLGYTGAMLEEAFGNYLGWDVYHQAPEKRHSHDKNEVRNSGIYFELELKAQPSGNPFLDVTLEADFMHHHRTVRVAGFYDGDDVLQGPLHAGYGKAVGALSRTATWARWTISAAASSACRRRKTTTAPCA